MRWPICPATRVDGGNDHVSVNWVTWEHPEICRMLDTSVDPGGIGDGVEAWRDQSKNTRDVLTGLVHDLNRIVSGGWRGGSSDRAVNALEPIDQWSASVAETTERITALMDASGASAAQAKATVPPPKSFDWGELRRSVAIDGLVGMVDDVVAQEQAQSEAHAEAVRIMTDVYSAPINDYRAAVPTYPQLVDPTLQPPEQPPKPGPAPAGLGYPGGGVPGGGAGTHGGGVPGAGAGTQGSGHVAHTLSAPVALQGVTSGGAGPAPHGGAGPAPHGGGRVASDQSTRQPQHVGGQVAAAAAAAGVPMMAPIAGGDVRRARTAGGGVQFGDSHSGGGRPGAGGQVRGIGRVGTGHAAEFGPRPAESAAAESAESRIGAGLGRGAGGMGVGRAGVGEMMAPMGGGLGKGGEDSEHRRPSYLIEMDDVFTDGRKVAPAVIGEDLSEQDD
jgi:hypothetical protein